MNARAERTQIKADQVIEQWAKIAFAPVPLTEISVSDQLRALEALARHLGMFTNKLEVSGTLTLAQLIQQSFTRDRDEAEEVAEAAE